MSCDRYLELDALRTEDYNIDNFLGLKCRECADGYYNNNGVCVPCGCDSVGASSGTCHKGTGQCTCRDAQRDHGVPRTCFSCASGQYFNQDSGQCIGRFILTNFKQMKCVLKLSSDKFFHHFENQVNLIFRQPITQLLTNFVFRL